MRNFLRDDPKYREPDEPKKFFEENGIEIAVHAKQPDGSELPVTSQHLSLEKIGESLKHWRVKDLGCYVNLWKGYGDKKLWDHLGRDKTENFVAIYADQNPKVGRGGFLTFYGTLSSKHLPSHGSHQISKLSIKEIDKEQIEAIGSFFNPGDGSHCSKSKVLERASQVLRDS
uniref:Uncharacterized protein n=1 Tax=Candidatus Kentrum sp. LPFa TaxID=2126335 RepID=A0A450WSI8_9GAMM|nr:MAG: hypothetical protein BECKLPF1236B_GA0070989_11942 [Candidatus Kentron sp. LPFa]